MARPVKCRRIGQMPVYRAFSPEEAPDAPSVQMTVDEYETIKLLDGDGLTQEACASRMGVSRPTVTAIYDSARRKLADAWAAAAPMRLWSFSKTSWRKEETI